MGDGGRKGEREGVRGRKGLSEVWREGKIDITRMDREKYSFQTNNDYCINQQICVSPQHGTLT